MLNYYFSDFQSILDEVKALDSDQSKYQYARVMPREDLLAARLVAFLKEASSEVFQSISRADMSDTEKGFSRKLNFDYLTVDSSPDFDSQSFLNVLADSYLEKHPESVFEPYTRNYIRYQIVPSKWGFGFDFFSGYGKYTKELGENFGHHIPLGVAFHIQYNQFILYLRDYIGIGKTRDDMTISSTTWEKDAKANFFIPEASIGYVIHDADRFKIAPYLGIAASLITPTERSIDENPEYKNVDVSATTYSCGMNVDLKLGSGSGGVKMVSADPEEAFWFVRLRYGYGMPQFEKKYGFFEGNVHYISIGIGGFGRKLKRDF